MKQLLLIGLLSFNLSCGWEEVTFNPGFEVSSTYIIGSKNIIAKPRAVSDPDQPNLFHIYLYLRNQDHILREYVELFYVKKQIGFQDLTSDDISANYESGITFNTFGGDGDIGLSYYSLDQNYPGYVEISMFDTLSHQVVGEFNAVLKREYPNVSSEKYPDTLYVVGQFSVELQ